MGKCAGIVTQAKGVSVIIKLNPDGSVTGIVGSLKDGLPIDLDTLGTFKTRRQGVLIEINGEFYADLFLAGGGVIGPYPDRQAAINGEIEWLRDNVL